MAHFLTTSNPEEAAKLQAGNTTAAAHAFLDAQSADEAEQAQPAESVWRDGDPDVGDWVVYQPRRGMIRRGRNRVAALVTHRYPDARLFDLGVFYEANDTLDDQHVPEAVGDERGWSLKAYPNTSRVPAAVEVYVAREEIEVLRQNIADLHAFVFGAFNKPEVSVLDLLSMLDERVDRMECAKPKTKRKYTRKAKAAPKSKQQAEPKAE